MNIEPLPLLQEKERPSQAQISGATLLNQWIYELILPFIKGRILEIGTGNAAITGHLISGGFKLRISDPDRKICDSLKERFLGHPQIKAIHKIDPGSDDFEKQYDPYLNKFDTVILLNKVDIPGRAEPLLTNLEKLLRPGGHMLVRLRLDIGLYNELDELFEYWKQISRRSLKKTIGRNFEIIKSQFFNIPNSSHPLAIGSNYFRQYLPEFSIDADQEYKFGGIFVIAIAKKIKTSI